MAGSITPAWMNEVIAVRRRRLLKRLLDRLTLFLLGYAVTFAGYFFLRYIKSGKMGDVTPKLYLLQDLAAFAAMLGMCIATFFTILVIRDLLQLVGHPMASRSPTESIKLFYKGVLTETGKLAEVFDTTLVNSDSMFYLRPGAVESIGGWSGFEAHWNAANKEILEHARSIATHPISYTEVKISGIKPTATSEGCCRYSVSIAVSSWYPKKGDSTHSYKDSESLYTAENELLVEDGRWYLTSAKWNGLLNTE
jgi:hypothetical protein